MGFFSILWMQLFKSISLTLICNFFLFVFIVIKTVKMKVKKKNIQQQHFLIPELCLKGKHLTIMCEYGFENEAQKQFPYSVT